MSKQRLGLVFGGRSEEHEVSVMSARSVLKAIDKSKYIIIPLAISREGYWLSPDLSRKVLEDNLDRVPESEARDISFSLIPFLKTNIDIVFPVLHGPYGEDGRIQGFLEMIDMPYVGTKVMGSALGMDKIMMKEIFAYKNLPQTDFIPFTKEQYLKKGIEQVNIEIKKKISYPCFIKPSNMGSSIGVMKIYKEALLEDGIKNALKHDRRFIVEEFVKGREVECAVLGNIKITASLPGEIIPCHDFYDYEAKYKDEITELIIPADLDNKIIDEVKDLSVAAFKAIDGSGFARVDFFIRDNDKKVLINEINTIPGFTQYSMYPKLMEISGLTYTNLIDNLIELALIQD